MSSIYQFLLGFFICTFVVHHCVSNPIIRETELNFNAEGNEESEHEEYGINPPQQQEDESEKDESPQTSTSSERKHKPVGSGNSLIINTPAGPEGTQVTTPIGGGNVHNPESTSNQGIPGIDSSRPNPSQGGGGVNSIEPAVQQVPIPVPNYP